MRKESGSTFRAIRCGRTCVSPYWKERVELDRFLEQVRREKLAISPFDCALFTRISTGVFDGQEKLLAVIGVNAPGRFSEEEIRRCRDALREVAADFARQL